MAIAVKQSRGSGKAAAAESTPGNCRQQWLALTCDGVAAGKALQRLQLRLRGEHHHEASHHLRDAHHLQRQPSRGRCHAAGAPRFNPDDDGKDPIRCPIKNDGTALRGPSLPQSSVCAGTEARSTAHTPLPAASGQARRPAARPPSQRGQGPCPATCRAAQNMQSTGQQGGGHHDVAHLLHRQQRLALGIARLAHEVVGLQGAAVASALEPAPFPAAERSRVDLELHPNIGRALTHSVLVFIAVLHLQQQQRRRQ